MTSSAAELASRVVARAMDDPSRRLALAADLYADRPGRRSVVSYRRAELAFMQWQVSRGVLAPLDGVRPGSPWWRAVNADLLRDAAEADHLLGVAPGAPSRPAVQRWVEFLRSPSPRGWYRAHNASIVSGYLDHRALVERELPTERFFMDATLGRVLFVQVMLLDPRLALGPWVAPIGRLAADPRSRGVDAYLSLRNVLPDEYPISQPSIAEVLDAENFVGRLLDYGVLLPKAQALYERAAKDLDEPRLLEFVSGGNLIYAWPYDDRIVWQARRHRRLTSLTTRITNSRSSHP